MDTSEAGGSSCSRTVADSSSYQVFVRTVDSDSEVSICARHDEPTMVLKCEILRRLPHIAAIADVDRCAFIFDGRLLESDASLEEQGAGVGSKIVVVPPRAMRNSARRCSCKGLLLCARRTSSSSIGVARNLPKTLWQFLHRTWCDPWSLVRPPDMDKLPRGRRVQTLNFNERAYRYVPGQNPRGEDFTLLFSQGLIGGG